jgi:hypothetical protein
MPPLADHNFTMSRSLSSAWPGEWNVTVNVAAAISIVTVRFL